MKYIIGIAVFLVSSMAFATTQFTCISELAGPKRLLTLTTLGEDIVSPQFIELEGFLSIAPFKLKAVHDPKAEAKGLLRYIGKRKLEGFAHPVQQTVFLAMDWSENEGRLLQVVVGGEKISYDDYNCTED